MYFASVPITTPSSTSQSVFFDFFGISTLSLGPQTALIAFMNSTGSGGTVRPGSALCRQHHPHAWKDRGSCHWHRAGRASLCPWGHSAAVSRSFSFGLIVSTQQWCHTLGVIPELGSGIHAFFLRAPRRGSP